MPAKVEVSSVKLAELDPKQRDLVSQAAVDELGLARKRIAELEGQLTTRRGLGFRASQAMGMVVVLGLGVLVLVSALAAAHRLLMWGWP